MFAWLSSHSPLLPYAAGSAPRTTHADPERTHPVSGTDPVSTARCALARTWFAFGRIVLLIRCTPAAKQNVVPAGFELTIDCASCPGLITTPTHGPATAGPALSELTTGGFGTVGSAGFVGLVAVAVGVRPVPGFVVGCDPGVGEEVGFGLAVGRVVGVAPGRCEGSTRDAACSDSWNLAVAVRALCSFAITGTATATTATAAASSAVSHNFLNALSWEWARPGCSYRGT
ncbi:hypothetical protein GCM10010530_12970 [Kribbella aluminosa]